MVILYQLMYYLVPPSYFAGKNIGPVKRTLTAPLWASAYRTYAVAAASVGMVSYHWASPPPSPCLFRLPPIYPACLSLAHGLSWPSAADSLRLFPFIGKIARRSSKPRSTRAMSHARFTTPSTLIGLGEKRRRCFSRSQSRCS
jgi:hypothetical protein